LSTNGNHLLATSGAADNVLAFSGGAIHTPRPAGRGKGDKEKSNSDSLYLVNAGTHLAD
jgi:hypothetical protein